MAKRRAGKKEAQGDGEGEAPRRGGRDLDPGRLRAALAEGKVEPAYLVVGEESYLRLDALAALRDGLPRADLTEFDGAHATPAQVLDEWRTVSFLGDRRLVVVRGAGELVAGHPDVLLAAVSAPPPNATLVLEATKVDRR